MGDENVAHPDEDVESSWGSDDGDKSTPLVTLKPNHQQDGPMGGSTGNVESEGPTTRPRQLPSTMIAVADGRAIIGSPPLSCDGGRGGPSINSPQEAPMNGSAYGVVTPTSPRGSTPQYGRSAQHCDITTPATRPAQHFDISTPASESSKAKHTSTWEFKLRILHTRYRKESSEMLKGCRAHHGQERNRNLGSGSQYRRQIQARSGLGISSLMMNRRHGILRAR